MAAKDHAEPVRSYKCQATVTRSAWLPRFLRKEPTKKAR